MFTKLQQGAPRKSKQRSLETRQRTESSTVGLQQAKDHERTCGEVRHTVNCFTAVFCLVTKILWGGALRDDTKNGCGADETYSS